MSEARVRVSLTDGVLEFEGPENFVSGLVEKFTSVIQTALSAEPQPAAASAPPVASAPPAPGEVLKDIFATTETGVQILRSLPGSSKAQRVVNVAKLYLYGLQVLKHRESAHLAEIARACKAHGCYDPHNMAACLKRDRASFVFGGQGKRQTVKLSAPGSEGIAALIARVRAGRNGITSGSKGITGHVIPSARQARESAQSQMATRRTSRH
jgi:hypothetical protein